MKTSPVNFATAISHTDSVKEPEFKHFPSSECRGYSFGEKAVTAFTTGVGVVATTAVLAKRAGYSLNYKKVFSNIKNSYLAKVRYEDKQIIPIGIGSCLGGLAGGYMVDKNPENRRAKKREALMQIGNISIPILAVSGADRLTRNKNKYLKAGCTVGGFVFGVYIANILMNIFNNVLFRENNSRSVKITDFSVHLDDMVVAAQYLSDAKIIYYISRAIPPVLMIPGYESGTKKAGRQN